MDIQHLTSAEQDVINAARGNRKRCACGKTHADGDSEVSSNVTGRMKRYLATHPGEAFAADEETGVVAVIIAQPPGSTEPPDIIAWSRSLADLLDTIGAPSTANLS